MIKHYIRHIILLIIITPWLSESKAQVEMLTNQYAFQDFHLNPAKIIKDKNVLNLFYRNQWVLFKNSPKMYSVSSNIRVLDNFYVGGIINKTDFGGAYSSMFYQLNAAYRINLGQKFHSISIGEGFKVSHLRTNYANLLLTDEADPKFPQQALSTAHIDFTAGIFYRYDFFKAGIAINSINGIIDRNKSIPFSDALNADIGFLFKHKDRSYAEIDQSTQLNFRGRLNQFNNLQLEVIFDCYATPAFSFGAGYRHDVNNVYSKFYAGNSLIAHFTIRIADLSNNKKMIFGFGSEVNAFNQSLDMANTGTYEGVLAFEKHHNIKSK